MYGTPHGELELEIGVVRGGEWVFRGVFRPPAMISVGSSPSAVLPLPASDLPEYHELIRLQGGAGVLFFEPGMAVELRLKEGVRREEDLLRDGLALITGTGWRVPLGVGTKGAFRVRDVAVLFKVRPRSSAALKAVRVGAPCGSCGAELQHPIVGFGALSPCSVCGALNEVQAETSSEENRRTAIAPTLPGKNTDLPTFDAISAFDAQRAQEALDAELSAAGAFGGPQQSEPTRRMPEFAAMGIESSSAPTPIVPMRVVGADLPTFDAISAVREEGLSTQAAIQAMRGGADGEPPVQGTIDGPIPLIAPFRGEGSLVELSIEDQMQFFGVDDDLSIDLQKSFTTIPVLATRPMGMPAVGSEPATLGPPLRPVSESGSQDPGPTVPMPVATPPSRPAPVVAATARIVPPPPPVAPTPLAGPRYAAEGESFEEEGSDDDDFLMGRIAAPDAVDPANRWLLFIGAVTGVAGIALILYTLLQ